MKKKVPTFKTDMQAVRFVAGSNLTQYDLSGGKAVQFGFESAAPRVRQAKSAKTRGQPKRRG